MRIELFIFSLLVSHAICQYKFTCDPTIDCTLESTGNTPVNPKHVPDPSNSQNFRICEAGQVPSNFSYTCGENFYYDGERVEPGCIEGSWNMPICTGRTASECYTSCGEGPDGDTRIAYPGKCGSSYLCTDFGIFEAECEDPSHYFNGTDCVADDTFACCNTLCNIPTCDDDSELKTLPDRYGCQNFYLCLDNTPLLQKCETGMGFDIHSNKCTETPICDIFCSE